MFERLTDEARRTVVHAQEESRMLQHNYIGTEHLLLGLLHTGEGVAAEALTSAGASLEDVRQQVVRIVGPGKKEPIGSIPFTPRAKKVLELSLRESLELGDELITSGHILLALMREGSGVAMEALAQLRVDFPTLRGRVVEALGPGGPETEPPRERHGLFRRAPASSRSVSERELIGHGALLERLDDAAWESLTKARESTRTRKAEALAPIDLLAGVAAVAGPAADALRAAGVDLDALAVAARAVPGGQDVAPPALPFTMAAVRALAAAAGEASRYGHPAVTTAHLLLALLVHADDDESTTLLDGLGVDVASLRTEITKAIGR
jgi:hypothetical protein